MTPLLWRRSLERNQRAQERAVWAAGEGAGGAAAEGAGRGGRGQTRGRPRQWGGGCTGAGCRRVGRRCGQQHAAVWGRTWCSLFSSEMCRGIAITPECRSPAEGREGDQNRTDIYIALSFPFSSLQLSSVMGRRKIEIQPITVRFLSVRSSHSLTRPQHERNRSVTFLKVRPPLRLFSSLTRFQRKNGLFKKAYELGVLCSVDVAVIVFDNKQGGPRLYQYGSDDVITIVERAMRVRATPLSSDVRSTPFSPVRGRSGHQTALRFQRSVASRPRRGRGRGRGPSPVSDVQEADRVRLDQAHTHSPNPATTILRLSSSAQARPCRIHRNPLRGNSCRKQLGSRWAPSPGPYSPVTSTPSRSVPPVPGALHKPSVLDSSALQHGPTTTPTVTFPRLSYRPPEPPPIRGIAFCWSLRSPTAEPKPRSL